MLGMMPNARLLMGGGARSQRVQWRDRVAFDHGIERRSPNPKKTTLINTSRTLMGIQAISQHFDKAEG